MVTLKKNIFYSTILTTANYIFPLLTYPYVSRVLGVDKIGICNFVDSIINYFVLFSMLGVGIVGIREIAKNKNDKECLNKTFNSLFFLNTLSTTINAISK
jgi:O-antigen/teichoic acid export membrane protein